MSCGWKGRYYCLGFYSLPHLWKVFSICPYLDPAFWNYFCLVKQKLSNPCSQKCVRIQNPWREQSLATRNGNKSPPFLDTLSGFILLTIHPAFNPINSHSWDFKELQCTHLILQLWPHVNLLPQRLILVLSFVVLLCLILPSGGLLFHLCESISSGFFPLLLNHFLHNKHFFKN